jgi:hypothetical protein
MWADFEVLSCRKPYILSFSLLFTHRGWPCERLGELRARLGRGRLLPYQNQASGRKKSLFGAGIGPNVAREARGDFAVATPLALPFRPFRR